MNSSAEIYRNPPELPDDILIYATRMFLPDAPGLDLSSMVKEALTRLRDYDNRAKTYAIPLERARWRASDPVWIANEVMMFVRPQLAGDPRYHFWHGQVSKLRLEREERAFPKAGQGTL